MIPGYKVRGVASFGLTKKPASMIPRNIRQTIRPVYELTAAVQMVTGVSIVEGVRRTNPP